MNSEPTMYREWQARNPERVKEMEELKNEFLKDQQRQEEPGQGTDQEEEPLSD